MAPSPKVTLNHYLNDLDTYQRKKKNRDPTNRVNIPYYRKVTKLNNQSSVDNANEISIASQLVLVQRDRKNKPLFDRHFKEPKFLICNLIKIVPFSPLTFTPHLVISKPHFNLVTLFKRPVELIVVFKS